ncbi:ShlB/FhaC/HecB family hemolysin secretion/activation protein [Trinickia fusca]|nr:ShlB/FhaC/HecB family hemolysin secretion/activation protein [Trinickia fusca]
MKELFLSARIRGQGLPWSRAGQSAWVALAASVAVSSACPALAQQAQRPDAGQLLRENVPALPQPSQGRSQGVTEPPAPAEPTEGKGGATVFVRMIHFKGNAHIEEAALRRAIPQIAGTEEKSATLGELDALASAVTHLYRQQGYLAALAYVPRQAVTDGVVTIAVLEGQLDRTRIGEHASYAPERLLRFENEALCGRTMPDCVGTGLTRDRLDRALGVVADLPGVASTSGTLAPGSLEGTTNFTLNAEPGQRVVAALGVDDFGNKYTGRTRGTADVRWNNPLGIGDLATADMVTSGRGATAGTVDYSLPVGYDGWRVGLDYAHFLYTLGAPFDVTNAHGRGDTAMAYATYPLVRHPNNTLTGRVSGGVKWLVDDVTDITTRKREQLVGLSLDGNALDGLGGGGATAYSASVTQGNLVYGGTPLAAGMPNAAGRFSKLNANVSRDQTLAYFGATRRLSLYGAMQGQLSSTNLDSAEKLYLGGPSGVRGYPVGEAPGDEGVLATLELRYSIATPLVGGSDVTFSVFRDEGWIDVNHSPWTGYSGPAHRTLGGTGIGVELRRRDRYQVNVMWAMRDAGGERDTSEPDSRSWLWLQARVFF